MAGFTDKAFRALAARLGATDATTEMVSAKATVYGDEKTFALAALAEDEPRTALQLFGHEPDDMAVAVRRLLTEADKAKIVEALAKYNGVEKDSYKWDMNAKTLTLRYDSMQIAQANIRYAIDEKGVKVAFPVKTDNRAGH